MDETEFEQKLAQLIQQNASIGTEGFRDSLLTRCLAVLNADNEGTELTFEQLDLLSAAGDSSLFIQSENNLPMH